MTLQLPEPEKIISDNDWASLQCKMSTAGVLQARAALYHAARQRHPHRWSGTTRNWTPIGPVTLNPERNALAATCVRSDRAAESKRLAA